MDRLMAPRSSNTSESRTSLDRPLRDFEFLPVRIRHAFADAPYDFAFGDILAQIRLRERELDRGLNDDEIDFALEAMAKEAKFQVEVSAYAFYGEHHPQARIYSGATLHKYGLLAIRNENALWRAGKGRTSKGRRR
jgi:hypothetical protein